MKTMTRVEMHTWMGNQNCVKVIQVSCELFWHGKKKNVTTDREMVLFGEAASQSTSFSPDLINNFQNGCRSVCSLWKCLWIPTCS